MVGGQLVQLVAEALWSHRSLRCNTRPTLDAARELLAQGCAFHTAIEAGCLPAIAWRGQIAQMVAGIMYVTQNLGHIRVDH